MNYQIFKILAAALLGLVLISLSCNRHDRGLAEYTVPEAKVLNEYKPAVAFEDNVVGRPIYLDFDHRTYHLFAFDFDLMQVLEIDQAGSLVHRYGGEGRGPGELQAAWDIFVAGEHLYIDDHIQYVIHKYRLGEGHLESIKYGVQKTEGGRPPPPRPVLSMDVYNNIFIASDGSILEPSVSDSVAMYRRVDWEGNHLTDIGDIPARDQPPLSFEVYKAAIENKEVPREDKQKAFPVSDPANPGEIFLVYGAIPRISKYTLAGEKLWEKDIPATPEIDSLINAHYEFGSRYWERSIEYRPTLRKYATGLAGPGGDLYLSTFNYYNTPVENKSLWIHHFSPEGTLKARYKLKTPDDIDLLYYFTVDTENRRFYVIPFEMGEIWAYSY